MANTPAFDYIPPGFDLDTIMRDVGNPDNLPAYQVPNTGSGDPQAPWWAPLANVVAGVGVGFANRELYGTPGTAYTGPTPYITLPGGQVVQNPAYAPGSVGGIGGISTTTIILFAAVAGVLILARR